VRGRAAELRITGADGHELSDRWQEALKMRDVIRALWRRIASEDR
jgi:hypothetical protein